MPFESEKLVAAQVGSVLQSERFKRWFESVKPKKDGYVVFNNSFLFRENPKANKGLHYLGVAVKLGNGGIRSDKVFVLSGMSLNSDYQFLQEGSSSISQFAELAKEATGLVTTFGRVGFVLIGTITDDAVVSGEISNSGYENLILNPKVNDLLTLQGNDVIIRELLDEDALWHELQNQHRIKNNTNDDLPNDLAAPLSKALNSVRQEAFVRLKIPNDGTNLGRTMLDDTAAFVTAAAATKNPLMLVQGTTEKTLRSSTTFFVSPTTSQRNLWNFSE